MKKTDLGLALIAGLDSRGFRRSPFVSDEDGEVLDNLAHSMRKPVIPYTKTLWHFRYMQEGQLIRDNNRKLKAQAQEADYIEAAESAQDEDLTLDEIVSFDALDALDELDPPKKFDA